MHKPEQSASYSLYFIYVGSLSVLGILMDRTQTLSLGITYFCCFFSYFWLVKLPTNSNQLFVLGALARLLMFFSLPILSDDFYRFLWDGHLTEANLDPYSVTPGEICGQIGLIPGLTEELYQGLNSPDYFTVYPPINQLLFWISTKWGNGHWLFSVNIMRIVIFCCETGTFFVLRKILYYNKKDPKLSFWYFLNPLVIVEFTGNLHFEGIVIFFLMLGLWLVQSKKNLLGGVSIGLAIGTKLVPLIFLPALLLAHRWKQGIGIVTISGVTALLSFSPMLSYALVGGISDSLALYFNKFEFNASWYFIFREVGYWLYGYNTIHTLGPTLSLLTFFCIAGLAFWGIYKKWILEKTLLLSSFIYLSMSTTVHPWYLIVLIPLGILSGYYFPIFWSLVVFVTYFGYHLEGFELSMNWVVLEYGTLWLFIFFETKFAKKSSL